MSYKCWAFKVSGRLVVPLLAGVALCAFSSVGYADEAAEEVATDYKISSQIVKGAKKTYLEESPYAERQRELEAKTAKPPIRRRPMRFSEGEILPKMPEFGSDNSQITVGTAIPADAEMDAKIVAVPETKASVSLPEHIDDVDIERGLITTQPQQPVAVVAPPQKMEEGSKPESFIDGFFSLFDDEGEAIQQTQPAAAPQLTAPVKAPATGAPMKSVIIEKAPKGQSSIERTKQIVTPPEIRALDRSDIAPIPPLMLTQERFKEDLIMPEPPESALASIAEEIEQQDAPQQMAALPAVPKFPENLPEPEAPEDMAAIDVPEEPVVMPPKEVTKAEASFLEKTLQKVDQTVTAAAKKLPWMEEKPQEMEVAAAEPSPEVIEETQIAELSHTVTQMPVQAQVIMQPLENAKPVVLTGSTHASVVVEEAEAVEISDDSKMMLRNFPSGLNTPRVETVAEKVEISRAAVPNLEISKPEIKKHEALGISIEVKKPDLNINDYLVMAYNALQNDQLSLASEYYHEILEAYPQNEDATLGLATISHRMGDTDYARKLYRKLLMGSPRNPAVLNNFLVLVSEESPEKATQELLQLEMKNPHYDVIPAQLAAIYASRGKLDKAIIKMVRAIELNPDQLLYRYNLAVMLDHAGQRREAIQAYAHVKKALEQGSEIPTDISHIQERLTFLLSNRPS